MFIIYYSFLRTMAGTNTDNPTIYDMEKAKNERAAKNSANWFFLIAGLSVVNSIFYWTWHNAIHCGICQRLRTRAIDSIRCDFNHFNRRNVRCFGAFFQETDGLGICYRHNTVYSGCFTFYLGKRLAQFWISYYCPLFPRLRTGRLF